MTSTLLGGMRTFRANWCLLIAGVLGGCALALPAYNRPFKVHVVVVAPEPERYEVVIDGSDHSLEPVSEDGRVTLQFPVLPRYCDPYLFGAIRLRDRSVENRKIVRFVRDGRVVKRLSVNQIRRFPEDSTGRHRIPVR